MTTTDERCGTHAGYVAHRRSSEPACDDCKRAHAEYCAAIRRANPDLHARNLATQHARDRALRRLARRHPAEFDRLYREELRKNSGVAS